MDVCPVLTPATYAQWKRDLKLWIASQNGTAATQLHAKIIAVPPAHAKVGGLEYMDATEMITHARDIASFVGILGGRYSKTDAGKSWTRLTAFAQFSKAKSESYKEFRSRFQRFVSRLNALQMALIPQMLFNKALQALNLPESQLHIVLSGLETKNNPNDAIALKDIAIRMFETHRVRAERSDIYNADSVPDGNDRAGRTMGGGS